MIVLPDRRCGTVEKGGLYMISRKSIFGTLRPFTALAAPLAAEIANVRRPEVVDIARTLCGVAGLIHLDPHVDFGRFAKLPKIGLADFWGKAAGYVNTWDCVEETQRLGVCRRIANVPSVPLPCPILMLHAEAVVEPFNWIAMWYWLHDRHGIEWDVQGVQVLRKYVEDGQPLQDCRVVGVGDQPWREANSLGRAGDDDFMWHPYVGLWHIIPQLRERRLLKKFREECSVRFEEGIFGVSWISDFCLVLEDDQDEVLGHLAVKGVIPALTENDPRVKEA